MTDGTPAPPPPERPAEPATRLTPGNGPAKAPQAAPDAPSAPEAPPGTPASPQAAQPASDAPRASEASATTRRRGRPRLTEAATGETREKILAVAREEFSERGYEKTSVRGIAKAAGVDSALVHHYFGTKEQMFGAAVEDAVGPVLNAPDLLVDVPLEETGEQFARFVFGVWENPTTRTPLLAILRSAVTNETAAAVFRRLIASQLLRRVAARVDLPDAELRAELAAAQLVGCALLRYVIKVEPLASADVEQLIARVAPVVQGHLTAP
ncbi:TetR/AcrR family transcriptional regulator [Streptomyces acidiscabies]|uniref:TetR/AcrR family transcriptional regulator n=1 Tax=Streptomyces acidiscabies TaxID=42234 RepID=UPI00076F0DF1|nr:TetR family transcriptional regulator [Streptomyces acidiscabies]GAQ54801.1 HTH-type transcriptional repressor KstR2 [Streptomyces acidiscabies]